MMGGEIDLESVPGEGSTFWFTVRLGLSAAVAADSASAPAAAETLKRKFTGASILLAEDEPVSREVALLLLRDRGLIPAEVVVAEDVLQYRARAQGVAYKGHVADRLPAFAADLLRPSTTDVAPEAFPSYTRVVVPLDRYIEGGDRVRIKVRPLMR